MRLCEWLSKSLLHDASNDLLLCVEDICNVIESAVGEFSSCVVTFVTGSLKLAVLRFNLRNTPHTLFLSPSYDNSL